mmetsp:Transcript_97258/g.314068  ORF Transcript_97258/g.314068 Transcript_97258/m.314068 type:complete len:210 (-) Transcript_97258:264-893(-)
MPSGCAEAAMSLRPVRCLLAALLVACAGLACGGAQLTAAGAPRAGGPALWPSLGLAASFALALLGAARRSLGGHQGICSAGGGVQRAPQPGPQLAPLGGPCAGLRQHRGLARTLTPLGILQSPRDLAWAEPALGPDNPADQGFQCMSRQLSSLASEDLAARQVSTSTAFADQLITGQHSPRCRLDIRELKRQLSSPAHCAVRRLEDLDP